MHEIFGSAVHDLFDVQGYGVMGLRDYGVIMLRGYGVKVLHVLGLIWLWGYRYIEFSYFSKYFLRLGACVINIDLRALSKTKTVIFDFFEKKFKNKVLLF